ncbi:NIF3-like protein 1 [Euwallacea fornicatus]|uniref:NIF3-like protein 1 n=1 Tax=Euwallacea fornicatus TaxID=995702 RepID=UPI00338ED644
MPILKPRFLHCVFTKIIYKPAQKLQNFYISKRFYSNKFVTMPPNSGISLQEIIKKLQQIAPLNLAESWDNVGLLVEPTPEAQINSVLLTIDLTEDVVLEAITVGAQLIISYHPNIFRPLKSVTQSSWKERIIVQCIKNNISVFSPHTSWDAMANGVNDWLGSVLPIKESKPILSNKENPDIGMGRILTIETLPLKEVIDLIKRHIGIPHVRLGIGRAKTLDSSISTVALCAGSGASVLGTIAADLYLTGEMSHHEVLEATQRGINVILCNHSDSERGFLKTFQKLFATEYLAVHVSQQDRDCLITF